MTSYGDLRWAAAFLEGEGSFVFNPDGGLQCRAPQVDHWPLHELHRILGGNLHFRTHRISNWDAYGVRAGGVMMTLYPLMSPRRQGQIRKALTGWRKLRPHYKFWTTCAQGHEFSRIETLPSGRLRRFCAICHKRQTTAWRLNNMERWRKNQANYRQRHPERVRERE